MLLLMVNDQNSIYQIQTNSIQRLIQYICNVQFIKRNNNRE